MNQAKEFLNRRKKRKREEGESPFKEMSGWSFLAGLSIYPGFGTRIELCLLVPLMACYLLLFEVSIIRKKIAKNK